jgi:hypothetical protein
MDLKSIITTHRQAQPPRIVLHGPHGIGKSSFGASAPSPIFLPTEDGLTTIDVPAFPLATDLAEVWQYMKALIEEAHEYKTFVVDTIDWLERLILDATCKENGWANIEAPGYGKGYAIAMTHWEKFFRGLDKLRTKGMAIILLAHNEIKPFNPPDANAFDRYQIKLNKSAGAKVEEWADVVLFANFRTFVAKDKTGKGKATGGERVLYTSPNPAYRAKNRYSLPEEMEFNFNELMKGIKANGKP